MFIGIYNALDTLELRFALAGGLDDHCKLFADTVGKSNIDGYSNNDLQVYLP
jgi:hypothetical protein